MKHGQCKKKHRGFVKRNQHIPRDVVGGNNPSRRLLPPSNTPPSDGGSEGNCVPLNETHQHQPEKTSHTKTDSGSSPRPALKGGEVPLQTPFLQMGGWGGTESFHLDHHLRFLSFFEDYPPSMYNNYKCRKKVFIVWHHGKKPTSFQMRSLICSVDPIHLSMLMDHLNDQSSLMERPMLAVIRSVSI